MKWTEFWKTQILIGIATTIPFIGSSLIALFLEDRTLAAYDDLNKPSWAPPKIVNISLEFSPPWNYFNFQVFLLMWTVLLSMIGYASYRIWIQEARISNKTIISFVFYSITLLLNWATVFYGPTHLDFATIHQIVLVFSASVTAVFFYRIDKISGLLFLPYIYWLFFLVFLNYHLLIMNSDGEWFANRDGIEEAKSLINGSLKDLPQKAWII